MTLLSDISHLFLLIDNKHIYDQTLITLMERDRSDKRTMTHKFLMGFRSYE